MSKHTEIVFETEIVQHLTNNDWLEGKSEDYDEALADVVAYIKNTQPEAYEKFVKRYATDTDEHESFATQLLGDEKIQYGFAKLILDMAYSKMSKTA